VNKYFFFCLIFTGIISQLTAQNIELVGRLKYADQEGSSIWGYTDPEGREYALMGTNKGTFIADISQPSNPKELHFIGGSVGYWREIKTWKHYAYIVQDNNNGAEGLLIADLSNVQNSIRLIDFTGPDGQLKRAHTLYIDERGFLYVFGGSLSGCAIFDLNPDPENPQYLSTTSSEYIHDGYVRGDTLWASNIYNGHLSVWDIADKKKPVKITQFFTPRKFTHNAWLSDDSRTLFTTDEVDGASVAAYDVSDLSDIRLLDEFKLAPGETSIPHNVHVINDFLVMSHYTEGVVIADAANPDKIVKTGQYDTSPRFSGGGFFGCWGVYPYFPSGLIIASDIEEGLYILRPTYERASRFLGNILDANTLDPINKATAVIRNTDASYTTNFDGRYKLGTTDQGSFTLEFSAEGYETQLVPVEITAVSDVFNDVYLVPKATAVKEDKAIVSNLVTTPQQLILTTRQDQEALGVQLFNLSGQCVFSANSIPTGPYVIRWEHLPAGIYLLHISTVGKYVTEKVCKN